MYQSAKSHRIPVRRLTILGLIVVPLLALTSGIAMAGASSSSTWGPAQEVPNMGTLNVGGTANVNSISCGSAGNCSAGGYYDDGSHPQAFVVDESSGTWGRAQEVPNMGTLNFGNSQLNSISCSSAGNCSGGGSYQDGSNKYQAFVVDETNGSWGAAEKVPNMGTLNVGGNAAVNSVSCKTAGNCSAGGYYFDGSHNQAFVVNETNGSWGHAKEVPNFGTLNAGNANLNSISCGSAGNCSAGGYYKDGSNKQQAFVVNETNGSWGSAEEVPNFGTLNAGNANLSSISCSSAGNCSAGGYYTDGSGNQQAFVVDESGGTWGDAIEVPNTASLNVGGSAIVESISCSSAGNCSAGGAYTDSSSHPQAFVVDETNGSWGHAQEVPHTTSLNIGGFALMISISCSSAGNCSAGGSYTDGSGNQQAFVVDESGGTWGDAIEVPNTASLNVGGSAAVYSISCSSAGNCSAGGYYFDGPHGQVFVVDSVQATPPPTTLPPATTTPDTTVQLAATGSESGDLLWGAMAGLFLGAIGVAVRQQRRRTPERN